MINLAVSKTDWSAGAVKEKCVFLIPLVLLVISIIGRIPKVDENIFYNADATYHVLLTMTAYEGTPMSVHHFLPIVSLGNEDDKFIPWGATIPDQKGNYYYTSFSPAGYIAPYLFVKLFHLPINEMSLYVFNSILYLLCFLLTAAFFVQVFCGKINKNWIIVITALVYLFQPEIMHSQGIVYWHQSLFQLLFLFQLNLFVKLKNKTAYFLFFLLCLIVPYVEWTGYVSNIGFAITFFFNKNISFSRDKIEIRSSAFLKFMMVIILTIMSFVIFVMHYVSVISFGAFARVLFARFMARNFLKGISILPLAKGYIISYCFLLVIIILFLAFALMIKKLRVCFVGIIKEYKTVMFALCFVMLENIIMKEHAVSYSFDRIKAVFLFLFLLLCCVTVIRTVYTKSFVKYAVFPILITMAVVNTAYYAQKNNYYYTGGGYLKSNRLIAKSINEVYTHKNSILAHEKVSTRGYSNLLFGRGIYEFTSFASAREIALKKGKQYVVLFECEGAAWNMYDYSNYRVYDVLNDKYVTGVPE